jgi:amino acid transporter
VELSEPVSSLELERPWPSLGELQQYVNAETTPTDICSPGSILIAYTSVGFLVYIVMTALGEMAAWIPHSSGFAGYATRFCDPALGFALGWTYWCKYIITTPNQLTATALIIQEWKTSKEVNPGIWIVIFLFLICAINYGGIKFFGELEFWLSSFKVVVIVSIFSFREFPWLTFSRSA